MKATLKSLLKKTPLYPLRRAYIRAKDARKYFEKEMQLIKEWAPKFTENSNFYYELEVTNRTYLAHIISIVANESVEKILTYFNELENDITLREHIMRHVLLYENHKDVQVHYGRRIGWYAFVRICKPKVVVETGVDHGVGSCVLCHALIKNAQEGAPGRYFGTDINKNAGKLLTDPFSSVGNILYGDSIESIKTLNEKIDIFINDSDHSADYEYQEYLAIKNRLTPKAIILGDNSHATECLSRFSRENERRFIFFSEKPKNHWYPGAGIGISYQKLV